MSSHRITRDASAGPAVPFFSHFRRFRELLAAEKWVVMKTTFLALEISPLHAQKYSLEIFIVLTLSSTILQMVR